MGIFFHRQLNFSSQPGVANEILENEPKQVLSFIVSFHTFIVFVASHDKLSLVCIHLGCIHIKHVQPTLGRVFENISAIFEVFYCLMRIHGREV